MITQSTQIIKLLEETVTYDNVGIAQSALTEHFAYAEVGSIGAKEYWSSTGDHTVQPEARAKVFRYDYHGEKYCEIEGNQYHIYRSFVEGDFVSLYLEKRVRDKE